jgi:hypothetical protein
MPADIVRGPAQRVFLVAVVGTGLWLFIRLCAWSVGQLPGLREPSARWASTVGLGISPLVELAFAVALTALLVVAHRVERTPHLRRAAGVGLLMAIVPAAALLGMGDRAGLFDLAAIRATIAAVGVVATSMLVYRVGDGRTD